MGASQKELFVVHTKSCEHEHALADRLIEILDDCDYSVYVYTNWEWNTEETIEVYSDSEGQEIDVSSLLQGTPRFISRYETTNINKQVLWNMLNRARLVVLLYQIASSQSAGIGIELDILRHIWRRARNSGSPAPNILAFRGCPSGIPKEYFVAADCPEFAPNLPADIRERLALRLAVEISYFLLNQSVTAETGGQQFPDGLRYLKPVPSSCWKSDLSIARDRARATAVLDRCVAFPRDGKAATLELHRSAYRLAKCIEESECFGNAPRSPSLGTNSNSACYASRYEMFAPPTRSTRSSHPPAASSEPNAEDCGIGSIRVIGSTPHLEKLLGGTVALSIHPPYVAETGIHGREQIVRIADYVKGETVAQSPVPVPCHTLAFSPDGNHLAAIPGAKGSQWKTVLVYTDPWRAEPFVCDYSGLETLYHAAWLDERRCLLLGAIDDRPAMAVMDIRDKGSQVIYQDREGPSSVSSEDRIDDAYCIPSGMAVFSIGFGHRCLLLKMNPESQATVKRHAFPIGHDGYTHRVVAAQEGEPVAVYTDSWIGLFDHGGQEKSSLHSYSQVYGMIVHGSVCCNHGLLLYRALRRDILGDAVLIGTLHDWEFSKRFSYPVLAKKVRRGCEGCAIAREGATMRVAIEARDHTVVLNVSALAGGSSPLL